MDLNARIAQFENMAQADPENEMAHYSLGSAYLQADRPADAANAFLRTAELAPSMSKAYQMAGEALIKAGEKDRAAEVLLRGYTIASERGDRLPLTAMADLLRSLGKPVPEIAPKPKAGAAVAGGGAAHSGFIDRKTGRPGTQMARPPFKGKLGQWIHANISEETWDAWIRQGTKVINELRLDLSRDRDSEMYDAHMREYLGVDDDLYERIQRGEA